MIRSRYSAEDRPTLPFPARPAGFLAAGSSRLFGVQRALLATAALMLVSCSDAHSPASPEGTLDSNVVAPSTGGSLSAGTPEFTFLPPLVKAGGADGSLERDLLPFLVVEICRVEEDRCSETVARLDHEGEASERLRVSDDGHSHFHVNLHTGRYGLSDAHSYRLRVLVGPYELGGLDLRVTPRGGRHHAGQEYVSVRSEGTLPIRFWIGLGSIFGQLPESIDLAVSEPVPGQPAALLGVPPEPGPLHLLVEGESAAVIRTAHGVMAALPLFLDADTQWPSPPENPLDIMLFSDGQPVAWTRDAVTVGRLEEAPGAALETAAAGDRIARSFANLPSPALTERGPQEQWMLAATAALAGLAEIVAEAGADAKEARLIDALLASTGVSTALDGYADRLAPLAGSGPDSPDPAFAPSVMSSTLAASGSFAASSDAIGLPPSDPIEIDDESVGDLFTSYDDIKLFGETVIHETASTWESVKLAATFLGTSEAPGMSQVGAVLGGLDFLVNRIVVGLLPSDIDRLHLAVLNPDLEPGQSTVATVTLVAHNTPTALLTVQDVVSKIMAGMGEMAGDQLEGFTELTQNLAAGLISIMQGKLIEYGVENPDLNLETGLTMPLITWESTLRDISLVDRRTHTPDIIAGLATEVNWGASTDQMGDGRIYAATATGAFGERAAASNVVEVTVYGELVLEVEFAAVIEEAGINALEARAGYLDAGGLPSWQAGIPIQLIVEGGTLQEPGGETDSDGQFITLVQQIPGNDSVIVSVTANGARSQSLTEDVVARVPGEAIGEMEFAGHWVGVEIGPCSTEPYVGPPHPGWLRLSVEGDRFTALFAIGYDYASWVGPAASWHVRRFEGEIEGSTFSGGQIANGYLYDDGSSDINERPGSTWIEGTIEPDMASISFNVFYDQDRCERAQVDSWPNAAVVPVPDLSGTWTYGTDGFILEVGADATLGTIIRTDGLRRTVRLNLYGNRVVSFYVEHSRSWSGGMDISGLLIPPDEIQVYWHTSLTR